MRALTVDTGKYQTHMKTDFVMFVKKLAAIHWKIRCVLPELLTHGHQR
jgi:hypothetical protein